MSDKVELKPCPFCGVELHVRHRAHNPYARCATDGCKGQQLPLLNIELPDDVAAWNRRAALSQQPSPVAVSEPDQLPTDAMLDDMRRRGLSIDGNNAYKRDLIDCIIGTLMLGKQGINPPPAGHWAQQFWEMARAEGEIQESLAAASPTAPTLPAQEPAEVYAVRYLSHWDGEGDDVYVLAWKHDGELVTHEGGVKISDLLKYQGDKILNVWPLYTAAPATPLPVVQEPVAVEVMRFQLKHPSSGETHAVEFTRAEVSDGMEDLLYEKLSPLVCQCNGDTDHKCVDYIYDFELVATPPAAEQPSSCQQCAGTGYDCPDCIAAAEQPDTVPVPRELLERVVSWLDWSGGLPVVGDQSMANDLSELRALLGKDGDA